MPSDYQIKAVKRRSRELSASVDTRTKPQETKKSKELDDNESWKKEEY